MLFCKPAKKQTSNNGCFMQKFIETFHKEKANKMKVHFVWDNVPKLFGWFESEIELVIRTILRGATNICSSYLFMTLFLNLTAQNGTFMTLIKKIDISFPKRSMKWLEMCLHQLVDTTTENTLEWASFLDPRIHWIIKTWWIGLKANNADLWQPNLDSGGRLRLQ